MMPFKALTLCLLILLPFACFSQFIVTGSVFNSADHKPVAGASIFFNNATFGDATNDEGGFRIVNVKSGQYEMIVSAIGFETYTQTILVNKDISFPDILLKQKTIGLKEVKIRPNFNREQYYQVFKNRFLGSSENAKECQILNPDVLDIDYSEHRLTVSADKFIEIENRALGYKIKYLLTTFVLDENEGTLFYDGYVSFEASKGGKSQEKRWEKNRLKVYLGSSMHFLRSCMGDQLNDEGFKVLKLIRTPIRKRYSDSVIRTRIRHYRQLAAKNHRMEDSAFYWIDLLQQPKFSQKLIDTPALLLKDMLKRTDQKIIYALTNPDCLYVMYTKRHDYYQPNLFHPYYLPNYPITIISFKSPYLFFDVNGAVINPEAALLEGYWGEKRIGDSLPVDYETDESEKKQDGTAAQ